MQLIAGYLINLNFPLSTLSHLNVLINVFVVLTIVSASLAKGNKGCRRFCLM
jgi:hypothetical protein